MSHFAVAFRNPRSSSRRRIHTHTTLPLLCSRLVFTPDFILDVPIRYYTRRPTWLLSTSPLVSQSSVLGRFSYFCAEALRIHLAGIGLTSRACFTQCLRHHHCYRVQAQARSGCSCKLISLPDTQSCSEHNIFYARHNLEMD